MPMGAALDLRPWLARLEKHLAEYALGEPGAYRRWRSPGADEPDAANPYGSADAANLLYTLGRLPGKADVRARWVETLRDFQEPDTGWFREATHHEIHTTAHCLGALELFDARPRHRLAALQFLEAPGALERFLDGLDWRGDPWLEAHRGAGVYAARVLAGEASPAWQARYFAWLDAECDPATGLWRRGRVTPPYRWGDNRFPHLAGTFHYLFNLEHRDHPHPHPDALVRTCLDLFDTNEYPLAAGIGFAEIDWVYCIARAQARSGTRAAAVREALTGFARRYYEFVEALDWDAPDGVRDLHALFGALCAWAELQRALPGTIRTERPLRLVLDRRPFI